MAIYTIGHDPWFRPIIYVNIARVQDDEIEVFKDCISFYLLAIKKRMLKEYFIENWIMIIDLEKRSLLNLPLKALQSLIQTTSILFCGTLHKLILLNPSFLFYGIWKIVSRFIHEKTRDQISIISQSKMGDLLKSIDKKQLIDKYGGLLKTPLAAFPFQHTFEVGEVPMRVETENTYLKILEKENLKCGTTSKKRVFESLGNQIAECDVDL